MRLGCRRALRRRDGAPGHPAGRSRGAPPGLPAGLRSRGAGGIPCRDPAALRAGGVRSAGGHSDGRQGTRLPRCGAERRAGRRRDAPLPRLPCRGADLCAGRPARRAQRARRAGRTGARRDAGARRRGDSPRRRPRRRGLFGRRARAPPGASLPALLAPGANRADVGRGRARPGGRGNDSRQPWTGDCRPAPSCWDRRLASGCAVATAASSCSRPSTGAARWPRSATRSRGLPRAVGCAASPSASTSTPSDRPA